MVSSNIPKEEYVSFNDEVKFYIGDKVRIQYPEYRGGIIGTISYIYDDYLKVHVKDIGYFDIHFSKIQKMRRAECYEDFNTVPYYDAEEKEFWRTHWITKDGIKEKTPEDIKMLDDFFERYNKTN